MCILTAWLKNVFVRVVSFTWFFLLCVWFVPWLVEFLTLFLFSVSLLSFALLFPLLFGPDLNLFLHVAKKLNTDNDTLRERIEGDIDFFFLDYHILSFSLFSSELKQVIHDVGTIDLCELLETEPKTKCIVCSSYSDVGIVFCTCGHFLRKGSQKKQGICKYTMDLFSTPDYYINKGRNHGSLTGRSQETRSTTSPTFWRSARRVIFSVSMTELHEIIPQSNNSNWSNRRTTPTNGRFRGRRSYPPFDRSNWWLRSN